METEEVKQINYEEENKNEIQSEDDYISLEDFYLQSCRYGDFDDVVECLQSKIDPSYFDKNLNNAFHMCAANGNIKILLYIIEFLNQIDKSNIIKEKMINHQNSDGYTPLHWATINNKFECVEILIENKADCSIKNCFDKTALDEALNLGFEKITEIVAKNTKANIDDYKEFANEDYQVHEVDPEDEIEL